MNRDDFMRLTDLRIKEAQVLCDNNCYEGAYYLAGYAVECALKACIAKKTQQYDFPPSVKTIRNMYTHALETLIEESGLKQDRMDEEKKNPEFATNWAIVKDWSEEKRYNTEVDKKTAGDLLHAITDQDCGVMEWLKKLW